MTLARQAGALSLLITMVCAATTWSPSSAADPTPTCDGRTATTVVPPGGYHDDGVDHRAVDDVAVVQTRDGEADTFYNAGAGDDVVCVVGDGPGYVGGSDGDDLLVLADQSHVHVSGGDGDDHVEVHDGAHGQITGGKGADTVDARDHDPDVPVAANLGDGEDTYLGGPEADRVHTDSTYGSRLPAVAFHDVVDTGAGDDEVVTGPRQEFTDQYGDPDDDDITLGDGDDHVLAFGEIDGQVDGGAGADTVSFSDQPQYRSATLDTRAGVFTHDGHQGPHFSGLEDYELDQLVNLKILGSDASETFVPGGARTVTGDLGGGDDRVEINDVIGPAHADFADLKGGLGRDTVSLIVVQEPASLDLGTGEVHAGSHHATAIGFEDAQVYSDDSATVTGSAGPNRLAVYSGCGGTMYGLGGSDVLTSVLDTADCPTTSEGHGIKAFGGTGDDRLVGTSFADTLVGGPGRDVAVGRAGRDRCEAEIRRGCERR